MKTLKGSRLVYAGAGRPCQGHVPGDELVDEDLCRGRGILAGVVIDVGAGIVVEGAGVRAPRERFVQGIGRKWSRGECQVPVVGAVGKTNGGDIVVQLGKLVAVDDLN